MIRLAAAFSGAWRLAALTHFLVSAAVFWTAAVAAQGVVDSDAAPPGWWLLLRALESALLQPLAYWLLGAFALPWWTWPGLAATLALLALNSTLTLALCLAALRLTRPQRR